MRRSPARNFVRLGVALALGVLMAGGWWSLRPRTPGAAPPKTQGPGTDPLSASPSPLATAIAAASSSPDAAVVRSLVASEETLLALGPRIQALSDRLLALQVSDGDPVSGAAGVFAPSVSVQDVGPAPDRGSEGERPFAWRSWPVEPAPRTVTRVDLWRPLLDEVASFEHARIQLVAGSHPDGDPFRYESAAAFEALARMKAGEWRALRGRMRLDWSRSGTGNGTAGPWQISAWQTEGMEWAAGPRRLFAEVLDQVTRSPEQAAALRRSLHYEATVQHYRDGMKKLPHPYFAPISVNQKEGLSVVDIDGDGLDDLYLSVRLGKNMLLRNRGDGTFTEEAAAYGLDLPGHTTCALFADFDNDGDPDAMLGRSLLKTTYLENRDGRFHQHPIPPYMPMAVISMAAADYNGDGLLDVYLCTYRPAAPPAASPAGGVAQAKDGEFDWPDEFFPPDLAREYRRRVAEHRRRIGGTVLDQLGPPNVLLVNRGGGRFEPAPENSTVGQWRNSLQATWGDYNRDGRPDLYLANDWGLDALFRNDGPAGFTDVSVEAGITDYGYAMGASWGDYDNDGLDDLYVSNMYSEAGRRITARIPGLEPMFLQSAAGNWLYHGEPQGKFRQVAGLRPPAMTVMNAGWSWGGCFADFDNDRYLDLYVLSGYFTAPAELASGLDLESNLWRTMVRTDDNLARPSFRLSPEWKRTPPPDNLGPEIDARLAGVERQGDQIRVHSLQGHERNRFFINRAGRAFDDLSALSGLDHPGDSRGFAILDFDRDGWQDVALVNANQPMFGFYRNEMPAAGLRGGMIALRFVGGNRSPHPSSEFACRDGYGARVTVELPDGKLVREHRCGDGWAAQNSATLIVGIGPHTEVPALTVHWPSGRQTSTRDIAEGTLLTAYENPADSPAHESFTRAAYRGKPLIPPSPAADRPLFAVAAMDRAARAGARLRVYSTFTTWCPTCRVLLPAQWKLKDEFGPKGVDVVAVPIDPADDNTKLAAYKREWNPPGRLVNLLPAQRKDAVAAFAQALGSEPPLPSTVITDGSGRILAAQPGIPDTAALKAILDAPP